MGCCVKQDEIKRAGSWVTHIVAMLMITAVFIIGFVVFYHAFPGNAATFTPSDFWVAMLIIVAGFVGLVYYISDVLIPRKLKRRFVFRFVGTDGEDHVHAGMPDANAVQGNVIIRQVVSGWRARGAVLDRDGFVISSWDVHGNFPKSKMAVATDDLIFVERTRQLVTLIGAGNGGPYYLSLLLSEQRQRTTRLEGERNAGLFALGLLNRIADDQSETMGNSPYGALVREFTGEAPNIVLGFFPEVPDQYGTKRKMLEEFAATLVAKYGRAARQSRRTAVKSR